MKKPSTTQVEAARALVAREVSKAENAEELAAAPARVHQKLFTRLAALLGAGGARALFARSVKLAMADYPCLRSMDFETGTISLADQFTTCLRGQDPAVAVETAVALCSTVLALLTTLIGERLTFQVLRSAWPNFACSVPAKEDK